MVPRPFLLILRPGLTWVADRAQLHRPRAAVRRGMRKARGRVAARAAGRRKELSAEANQAGGVLRSLTPRSGKLTDGVTQVGPKTVQVVRQHGLLAARL